MAKVSQAVIDCLTRISDDIAAQNIDADDRPELLRQALVALKTKRNRASKPIPGMAEAMTEYASGIVSVKAMAEKHGIKRNTLYSRLKKAGLLQPRHNISPENVSRAIEAVSEVFAMEPTQFLSNNRAYDAARARAAAAWVMRVKLGATSGAVRSALGLDPFKGSHWNYIKIMMNRNPEFASKVAQAGVAFDRHV